MPGGAVVGPSGFEGRCVEGVDHGTALRFEGHVDPGLRSAPRGDPEERLLAVSEAAHARHLLHQELQAERGERLLVERLAPLVVADVEPHVVDHWSSWLRDERRRVTGGAVDPRTSSSTGSTTLLRVRLPAIRPSSSSNEVAPSSSPSRATVVSGGSSARAKSMSSKPMTETSSGIRSPRSRAAM